MHTSLEDTTREARSSDKPHWWTDSLEESWSKVKAQVMEEWKRLVEGGKTLDHHIAEEALAFGHGARAAYNKLESWSKELEARLQADWKDMARAAERKWEDVREAVKLGWERAKGHPRTDVPTQAPKDVPNKSNPSGAP